jgi:twitching motility two-component system response regulator PilH
MSEARPVRPVTETILVVDDDVAYLDFMKTLLESEGYAVRIASSLQALDAGLRPMPPALVICDTRLQRTPRFAVLDRLAADPATAAIPVLVCSGAAAELDAVSARVPRQRVATLLKPFDIQDLLAAVLAFLSLV